MRDPTRSVTWKQRKLKELSDGLAKARNAAMAKDPTRTSSWMHRRFGPPPEPISTREESISTRDRTMHVVEVLKTAGSIESLGTSALTRSPKDLRKALGRSRSQASVDDEKADQVYSKESTLKKKVAYEYSAEAKASVLLMCALRNAARLTLRSASRPSTTIRLAFRRPWYVLAAGAWAC